MTFHVKLPIFVARQWIRHRTARVNEISGRYSVLKDDFYIPAPKDLAAQSTDNKQGRSDTAMNPEESEKIRTAFETAQKKAYDDYSALVEKGLARELARINLPLSLYTQWYWQIDLRNLFHFLELRMDSHAQKEIRLYSEVMFEIAKKVAPLCCASFEEHVLGEVSFSKSEFSELQCRLNITGSQAGMKKPAGGSAESTLNGKAKERFEEKIQYGRQR